MNMVYRTNKMNSIEKYEDQLIIIDENMNIHCLNETAGKIWTLIEEGHCFTDMIEFFMNEYHVEKAIAESDIKELIDLLISKDLVCVLE